MVYIYECSVYITLQHRSILIYGEFADGYFHIIIELHGLDTSFVWSFVVIKYEGSTETYGNGMTWYNQNRV